MGNTKKILSIDQALAVVLSDGRGKSAKEYRNKKRWRHLLRTGKLSEGKKHQILQEFGYELHEPSKWRLVSEKDKK